MFHFPLNRIELTLILAAEHSLHLRETLHYSLLLFLYISRFDKSL